MNDQPATAAIPLGQSERAAAGDGALVVDGLGVAYAATRRRRTVAPAICGASFEVPEGAFASVIGPSGCGKSTLLKVIAGLLAPSEGRVRLKGQEIRGPGDDRAVVFQAASLLPWRTVLRNVTYGLEIRGMDRTRRLERACEVLALVGLESHQDRYPHELSGGMQQRVNLARALAVDPSLLLLDEPFSALDAQTREALGNELLRIWQEQGATSLLVTHQIEEAVFLSDIVIVFSPGPGGTVIAVEEVSLGRPRNDETRNTPEFAAMVARLRTLMTRPIENGADE